MSTKFEGSRWSDRQASDAGQSELRVRSEGEPLTLRRGGPNTVVANHGNNEIQLPSFHPRTQPEAFNLIPSTNAPQSLPNNRENSSEIETNNYISTTGSRYGSRQLFAGGEQLPELKRILPPERTDAHARPPSRYHPSRTASDCRQTEFPDPNQQNPDAPDISRVMNNRDRACPSAEDEPRRPLRHRDSDMLPSHDNGQRYTNPTTSTPINIPHGTLGDRQYDDLSASNRPAFNPPYSGSIPYGSARPGTTDAANFRRTPAIYAQPTTTPTTNIANTAATRTQRAPPPEPPVFGSILRLELRMFANLPRGRLQNVLRHIQANMWLLREDPEPLLQEAIQAFTFYYSFGETPHGNKSEYAENCIQQYALLKILQGELRNSHRSTTAMLNDFTCDLYSSESRLHQRLYEGMDGALRHAKTQAQSKKQPRPPGNTASSPPPQVASRRDPPDQGALATALSSQPQGVIAGLGAMTVQAEFVKASMTPGSMTTSRTQQSASGGPLPSNRFHSFTLDPSYQVRSRDFYQPGRVFAMVHHENYPEALRNDNGGSRNTIGTDNFTIGRFGERIYTTIRRMVVVRGDYGFAVCVGISSYGGRGLNKFKNPRDIEAHAQIHMTDKKPVWLQNEPHSSKRPIAVEKESPERYLTEASRVCFSQPHTIQMTQRTQNVGFVTETSMPYLLYYFKAANKFPDD